MICTRQQPEMLKSCLLSVLRQMDSTDQSDSIIVIENNDVDTSRSVVNTLKTDHPNADICYILEPELGIPSARQSGVDFALQTDAQWLAFIDDDEELEEGWFDKMRAAANEFECETITGPVRYAYPNDLPIWFEATPLKNKPRGTVQ